MQSGGRGRLAATILTVRALSYHQRAQARLGMGPGAPPEAQGLAGSLVSPGRGPWLGSAAADLGAAGAYLDAGAGGLG